MAIRGTALVTCPACGRQSECQLVQSINTNQAPADKQKLLDGDLNVLDCACGQRTQLSANILFHDPDADFYCQVAPGGEQAIDEAAASFAAAGPSGTQRIVPSQNALVEKVKLLDAGLADWAIEMTKVLLLASIGDLDRVLLFDSLDRAAGLLRWVLFDADDDNPAPVSSPLAAFERLASRPAPRGQLQIDRAWAVDAVKTMIVDAN